MSSSTCTGVHIDADLVIRLNRWLEEGKKLLETVSAAKQQNDDLNKPAATTTATSSTSAMPKSIIDDVIAGKASSSSTSSKSADAKAALEADATACYRMGNRIWWGWEAGADKRDATKLFERAAEEGHTGAQAWCYYIGAGSVTKPDRIKAFELWKSLADGELCTSDDDNVTESTLDVDPEGYAAMQVGMCYHNGYGVDHDESQAYKYYRLSASKGNAIAFNTLGHRCETHDDYSAAASYYAKASDAGYYISHTNYGRCLLNGRGVPKDTVKAAQYFKMAATAGDPEAAYQLGMIYFNGKGGVHRDLNEALRWIQIAANQDHEDAVEFLQGAM